MFPFPSFPYSAESAGATAPTPPLPTRSTTIGRAFSSLLRSTNVFLQVVKLVTEKAHPDGSALPPRPGLFVHCYLCIPVYQAALTTFPSSIRSPTAKAQYTLGTVQHTGSEGQEPICAAASIPHPHAHLTPTCPASSGQAGDTQAGKPERRPRFPCPCAS